MKSKSLILCILVFLLGCSDEYEYINTRNLESSQGLSLWWDHKIFGDNGRGYIFAFHEMERMENSYDLIFTYKIDQKRKTSKFITRERLIRESALISQVPAAMMDYVCLMVVSLFLKKN